MSLPTTAHSTVPPVPPPASPLLFMETTVRPTTDSGGGDVPAYRQSVALRTTSGVLVMIPSTWKPSTFLAVAASLTVHVLTRSFLP